MSALLVLLWDGFLILGEGLGLELHRARRFADVVWLGTAALVTGWLAALVILAT